MRFTVTAMLCAAALTSAAPAQERAPAAKRKPMDALAQTLLALTPPAGFSGTRPLGTLRAQPSPIRWLPTPKPEDAQSWKVGTLAGANVTAPRSDTPSTLTFSWLGQTGQPLGFNPVIAFRKAGMEVQALYCASMVSEGTNYFFVSAPGKRPGVLSVYAYDAPIGIASVEWTISYRLDGHVPTLEEAQAEADLDISTDCSTKTFGPVEQISHAKAVARTRRAEAPGS
ncbi:hypothetical protein LQ953_02130 [Sphingomonas sp. IC-56]|uniref:hypothetical protein n=1 Tax=Sphingomonas sp. IC-56 TaxID=2898529 RepID=UPI001E415B12|nr:hypothetical protein [Sphingomonas sp. IC-56]MCD2322810.1 hypothetical protein [Sphingomonas sp. IC-56]